MPIVHSPPNAISICNEHKSKNIEVLFEFASAYLTDDGPLFSYNLEKKNPLGTI